MKYKELELRIDKQIKKIIEMIDLGESKEKIKENQKILNQLLSEYLK